MILGQVKTILKKKLTFWSSGGKIMWFHSGKSLFSTRVSGRLYGSPWLLQSCFSSDISCKKSKLAPLQERKMIDRIRLCAKGGDGGSGCTSFRKSRHDRRGRPDGGNGGRGGDVIFECSPSIWDFSGLQHHINARRGGNGSSKNMIGSRGADKVVHVPVGTVIHLVEGEIPSVVEKSSSEALDPWEIPGSLVGDSSESSDQSGIMSLMSVNSTNASAAQVRNKIRTSIAIESPLTFASSAHEFTLSGNKSSGEAEASNSLREESCTVSEDQDGDDVSSGEEHEEEFEENVDIEYNVAELTEPGQQIVVAQGGDGGLGNISAAKSSKKTCKETNGAVSDDHDESAHLSIGMPGSGVVLVLELKSIADVGLVGMPNAGKSTLLGALSRAKPTVGHYAFTTLRPNLGNLNYEDFSITVADIPGITRGAHENRGLGHAFLRHIERTKVLAYVVDLAAAIDGRKGIPPWVQLKELVLELEFYSKGLSSRPSLVVANKIDEEGAEEVYKELKQRVPCIPIFPVCAVLEEGVAELKDGLRLLMNGEELHKLKLDEILTD